MISFFDRLAVKVFGEPWQVGSIEINRDRYVLLCAAEFDVNLLLQQGMEFCLGATVIRHERKVTAGQMAFATKVLLT
jgi:hypothetical protein